jgi:imidazoleglycerol-phosphate dehydratase/histidinol-phosphatase
MKRIVFIDRDGTIIREPVDFQIDTLEKLEFLPGIISGLRLLVDCGYALVMVTNQDGLGTKGYPKSAYDLVQKKIFTTLRGEGIEFEKIFVCPHRPSDNCACRKPKTGLVDGYLKKTSFDKEKSFMVGDRLTDIEFGKNIGVRGVLIGKAKKSDGAEFATTSAYEACAYIARQLRAATIERETKETSIAVSVAIDGTGEHKISTGLGFFDHMLDQLSKHSRIDIDLTVKGDLHIDEHHTVEDAGIALGTALRMALGDKRGTDRFAFAAPLDESLAQVSLDLSGRRHLSFDCKFSRERVGELPTELVEDFFQAFADGLQATIHISCKGRNDHHKIEAIFKSVALALREAARIDPKMRAKIPSTKGVL